MIWIKKYFSFHFETVMLDLLEKGFLLLIPQCHVLMQGQICGIEDVFFHNLQELSN